MFNIVTREGILVTSSDFTTTGIVPAHLPTTYCTIMIDYSFAKLYASILGLNY